MPNRYKTIPGKCMELIRDTFEYCEMFREVCEYEWVKAVRINYRDVQKGE